eukprot:753541-Hanusia_phi.AAC.3
MGRDRRTADTCARIPSPEPPGRRTAAVRCQVWHGHGGWPRDSDCTCTEFAAQCHSGTVLTPGLRVVAADQKSPSPSV